MSAVGNRSAAVEANEPCGEPSHSILSMNQTVMRFPDRMAAFFGHHLFAWREVCSFKAADGCQVRETLPLPKMLPKSGP